MTGQPGRPTAYRPEFDEQTYKLCLLGATNAELANFFSVHVDTIDEWRRTRPSFSDAIMRGRDVADANVAARLYARAMGYSHQVERPMGGKDGAEVVAYTENLPPDTNAASLWLRNRQPRKWRDRVEHTGADGGALVVRWERDEPAK